MKASTSLFAILFFVASSCKTPGIHEMTTPGPLYFELVGKNGIGMVSSLNDHIVVTYTDNNVTRSFNLEVKTLYVNIGDSTVVWPKYNGFYITDNYQMSDLSSRNSDPIRTFNISLNGTNLGVVYVDYWQYLSNYPQPSSPALTFNNVPVYSDPSIPVLGAAINLLQVQ